MKRIIDGVTYNTATSTLLATSDYEADWNHKSYPCEGHIYQTRGGAFFVHEAINLGFSHEIDEDVWKHRFEALSRAEAQSWIMTGETEIYSNPFEEPPEAQAEDEPSATIYVRVPTSLKQRVDAAAKAENLSANSWAMRCIEGCLKLKLVERRDC